MIFREYFRDFHWPVLSCTREIKGNCNVDSSDWQSINVANAHMSFTLHALPKLFQTSLSLFRKR